MNSESPDEPIEPTDSEETAKPIVVASYADLDQPADEDQAHDEAQSVKEDQPYLYEATSISISDRQLRIQFRNKGAAVTAIVLGCLAVFGAFLTQWSLFNAGVGIFVGLQGLNSSLFRTSVAGICLCLIGAVLCIALYAN